ncbi:MAG: TIGR01777 family protein [Desulfobacteraceae bacterium 4572_89]|nr:MAG: TIGR01777 family protein [Desulfobacteraceae bacterium 4572_89]
MFEWHAREGAILRLTPPWSPLKLISRTGIGIEKGVQVKFRMDLFKIPMTWEAEHIEYQENTMFKDHQTKGPFAKWEHTHLFHDQGRNDQGKNGQGKKSSVMEDQVAFKLPLGFLSLPFYGYVLKELARVFDYRHRVLKYDLEHRLENNSEPGAGKARKQRILISGASGSIGSILVPFLRTCGHEVVRLVRKSSNLENDELFWDPYNNILDMEKAGSIDAVINLNGADISRGRWSMKKRQLIVDSRVKPTMVLVEKMKQMAVPPSVFISSSAIGLYGEGQNRVLTEKDPKGDSFISRVCDQWEKASFDAQKAGIRTIQLRIGVVLTPSGGALKRMLLPFSLGLGTRLSKGSQYMSWISMDDALGGILHILKNQDVEGAVNLTAPNPVTNKMFTKILGRVMSRPAPFVLPRWMAIGLWGDMGKETLLTSARVIPEKLLKSGFSFEHNKIEPALKDMLGR